MTIFCNFYSVSFIIVLNVLSIIQYHARLIYSEEELKNIPVLESGESNLPVRFKRIDHDQYLNQYEEGERTLTRHKRIRREEDLFSTLYHKGQHLRYYPSEPLYNNFNIKSSHQSKNELNTNHHKNSEIYYKTSRSGTNKFKKSNRDNQLIKEHKYNNNYNNKNINNKKNNKIGYTRSLNKKYHIVKRKYNPWKNSDEVKIENDKQHQILKSELPGKSSKRRRYEKFMNRLNAVVGKDEKSKRDFIKKKKKIKSKRILKTKNNLSARGANYRSSLPNKTLRFLKNKISNMEENYLKKAVESVISPNANLSNLKQYMSRRGNYIIRDKTKQYN